MWVISSCKHHQPPSRRLMMLIQNLSESVNKATVSKVLKQFCKTEKCGKQTIRLNEIVNVYTKRITLTSVQDSGFSNMGTSQHCQVTCVVSVNTLPAKKNGWQEGQWCARCPGPFPISFVGTFNLTCMNTTHKCLIVFRNST